jgi:NADH-ubiquinone oxidoreductase chain 4
MLILGLLLIPLFGIFLISSFTFFELNLKNNRYYQYIALNFSVLNLILSFIVFILFDSSNNQFQFVQNNFNVKLFNLYLGVDGISIYFILLTTIIIPIAILSN